ncbi:MAG: hypothetical protein FWD48_03970 [Oscillospiraceae bacterium]|nr:hypothetical protein [Oscillospiraceae bacterium]
MSRIKPPTQPEKSGVSFKIPKILDVKAWLFGKQHEYDDGNRPQSPHTFLPIKDIRDGIVITADNRYIKVLEVLPVNFYLKSAIEQQNIIHYFANYLKIAPYNLQIIVQTGKADIDAYCTNMQELHDNEENENCQVMIQENSRLVNYLAVNEAITHRFFLVFQYENIAGASSYEAILKSLADHVNNAVGYLEYCGLEFVCHENPDDFLRQMLNKQRGTSDNSLSPACIDTTNKDFIIVDGVYYSYLYVAGYGYNTQNSTAWLAPFVEAGDGISFSFYAEKLRKEKILPRIAKITMLNRSRMRDIGDTRIDFEQLDDAIGAGMYIKDEMNRNGEEFYYMHTLIEITAGDEETLKKRIAQTETMCTAMDIAVKRADYKQKEAYLSSLPLLSLDPDLKKMSRRNVLTSGLAGSFPFSSFELCDQKGVFMGINRHNNSAVIADFFDSSKYSNANLSIMGMSGAGKTFLLQLMTLRLRMQGTQVFIIAPLKGWEFKKACEAIGGKYIKLSPGSSDCINIMEIRRTSMDIDSDSGRGDSVLADKVQKLHIFFSLLYPTITTEEKLLLDSAIIQTYSKFGITHDNSSLYKEDNTLKLMPTLKDLHGVLSAKAESKGLALALSMFVSGSASRLGGQTNVNLNNKYIVLDISEMGKGLLPLGMFLALDFVWDEAKKSRITKKAVCLDEVWELIGSGANELAADFVLEIFKIIRGLGGMAIAATQDLVDFFALSDGKYGKGILNNCRTKIILQLEEDEAQTVKKYLALSDEETLQIIRNGRGNGLLCTGRNRINVEFRGSSKEYDLITTNREDLERTLNEQ